MSVSPLRRAAIVAVGSELLTPLRTDTNSLFITEQLGALGIEVVLKMVVGDRHDEIAHAVRGAMARAELVVLTGGLGPTDDDVTRDVVARVLGRQLREWPEITVSIRQRFSARGWEMPEINRRQAMVPEGAEVLPNVQGTAPGLWIETDEGVIVLLPGPPRELHPMLTRLISDKLAHRASGELLARRVLRITGRTESHTDEVVQPLYAQWASGRVPITATILAALGQIELHLTARAIARAEAEAALTGASQEVVGLLGSDVYSTDGQALEAVVGDLLVARGFRIAVAESCTGGLITSRLTDVAGSSRYVDRAIVSYSNGAKTALLGVSDTLLAEHGAVSEAVALAMANGIRDDAGVDVGVGVTGIAGPGGGTSEKPVGTVAIAVVTPDASRVRIARFMGEREHVKFQSAQGALDMLRRLLLGS